MDYIDSPSKLAAVVGVSAQVLRRKCRAGEIVHATQYGNRWLINATREWPELKLKRKVRK